MSSHMLNDEDAINKVNPFVTHGFSLPGGVRQTGDFEEFSELKTGVCSPITEDQKSVFCDFGLCGEQIKPTIGEGTLHPKRNIDTGFTCPSKKKTVKVGVAKQKRTPYFGVFLILLFILLIVLYSGR